MSAIDANINWDDVIKKEARGINDANLGEVEEIRGDYIITKKGLVDKDRFYLPKNLAIRFDGDKLWFNVTKDETDNYKRDEDFDIDAKDTLTDDTRGTMTDAKDTLTDDTRGTMTDAKDTLTDDTRGTMTDAKDTLTDDTRGTMTDAKDTLTDDTRGTMTDAKDTLTDDTRGTMTDAKDTLTDDTRGTMTDAKDTLTDDTRGTMTDAKDTLTDDTRGTMTDDTMDTSTELKEYTLAPGATVGNVDANINWDDVIKKEARGINDANLGEVEEIRGDYIITKKGLVDKDRFYLPKNLAIRFDGDKLWFNVTKDETDNYKRDEDFDIDATDKIESDIAPGATVGNVDANINWDVVIKKEARGINDANLGEVEEIRGDYIITKKGLVDKDRFYLPKNLAIRFDGDKLWFNVTKDETDNYKRD